MKKIVIHEISNPKKLTIKTFSYSGNILTLGVISG